MSYNRNLYVLGKISTVKNKNPIMYGNSLYYKGETINPLIRKYNERKTFKRQTQKQQLNDLVNNVDYSQSTNTATSNSPNIFQSAMKTINNIGNTIGSAANNVIGPKAWNSFNKEYKDTPTVMKPLGFALSTPYRIPFLNRAFHTAGETMGTPLVDTKGKIEKKKSIGAVGNTIADLGGNLLGAAMTGREAGTNLLNFTDQAARTVGGKTASRLAAKGASKTAQKYLPTMARGAFDAGVSTGVQDVGQGKSIGQTTKDTLVNALLGGATFGTGKAIGSKAANLLARNKGATKAIENTVNDDLLAEALKKKGITLPNRNNISTSDTDLLGEALNKKGITLPNVNKTNSTASNDLLNQALKAKTGKTIDEITLNPLKKYKTINSKIENPKDSGYTLKQDANIFTNNVIRDNFDITAKPKQKIVSSEAAKEKNIFKRARNAYDNFYTRVVDINNPIKKVDENAYIKATNSKNVGGTVNYIMDKGLVNKQGKQLDTSLKDVIKSIPKGQENDFWEYALQRHNVHRAAEEKPIYPGFNSKESEARSTYLEQQHPEWKEKADKVTNWIDTFMKEWGVKSGLVNEDMYKALRKKYPNYLPTNREFTDLESFMKGNGSNGKGFVDQPKAIKKAEGSARNIIDPTENIMHLVNRTVRSAKYNEVGQQVLNAVRKDPVNMAKYAEIIKNPDKVDKTAGNIVKVFENGEPTWMKINDKPLLTSLENVNKTGVGDVLGKVQKVTNVYKSLITTKNPIFAAKNVARDIPTYMVNTTENNPLKALKNLGGAVKSIVKNDDFYKQYKALGGGGSNFAYDSGEAYKSVKELVGKLPLYKKLYKTVDDAIEGMNNIAESAPRLAEFKSVLKKTGDLDKAMYSAADVTTNFSRGGDITKKADVAVPYLNAGVQGLDKLARQFKNRPIATALKGATTLTVPTLLLNEVNKNNANYKELDNRTKDNYYLFPQKDGTFIKIPKSREYGVIFSSLAERIMRQAAGDKEAFKGYGGTVATNFAPNNPVENNLLTPATLNLMSNKDFAGRDIVPQYMLQDKRSKYLQYDEKNTEFSKALAAQAKKDGLDLSPKQIDYLVKSYTGVIGQLLQPADTKSNTAGKGKLGAATSTVTQQFKADPLYSNQSISDFYDNLNAAQTAKTDYNLSGVGSAKSADLFSKMNFINKKISALSKAAKGTTDINKQRAFKQKMIEIAKQANQMYNLYNKR